MRLCANENVPGDCVALLRQRGHDVLWIREAARGIESTAEWEGHYAVVDEHSIRLRPLP